MLVVIDTNIFISYLLVPASQPAKIVALWQSGKFDVLTAQPQIDELMRVTRYPKIKERILSAVKFSVIFHQQSFYTQGFQEYKKPKL